MRENLTKRKSRLESVPVPGKRKHL